MVTASASVANGSGRSAPPADGPGGEPRRLTFDLDVDVCVVGAGLAGLSIAREAARLGASVAVLERRAVGWDASGHQLGSVMPGFSLPLDDLVARVGRDDARQMWALSRNGMEAVRAIAGQALIPSIGRVDGALEVSNVDVGDRLIGRLQMLGEDFGTPVEGWQVDRVRAALKTSRYFHGVYYPEAFQINGRRYLHGLAALARREGVKIFEDTPVVSIDAAGIRKRIVTPRARMRAGQLVLAGNVHLGEPALRLTQTLLPAWRYAGITEPLGARLAEVMTFPGAVIDTDGIDQFRIIDGDRLMWASPETTWAGDPARRAGAISRRIGKIFPALGKVAITETFAGAVGRSVQGMPQIGEIERGLWVASGFGRQGLNTTAMAGQLIAQGMMLRDDRWKLFAQFDLVWAGGAIGRVVGHAVHLCERQGSAISGTLARYRERARARALVREERLARANRRAGTGA